MAKDKRAQRRKQEKKRERAKRLKRARNLRRNEPDFEPYEPDENAEYAGERLERRLLLLAAQHEFADEKELAEYLSVYASLPWFAVAEDQVIDSPIERAQELAFCALETNDEEEALDFVDEALELDPDNCDALATWAVLDSPDEETRVRRLYEAVEAGARALGGEEFFRETEGQFWTHVLTRPYMRTRLSLAHMLRVSGRRDEAHVELVDLVTLDRDDGMGVRYLLVGSYLERGELDAARALLQRFDGDDSACWVWARALERFLSGDREAAERARALGRERNPWVERMARGEEPSASAMAYDAGSPEEAAEILDALGDAWSASPQALEWIGVAPGSSSTDEAHD